MDDKIVQTIIDFCKFISNEIKSKKRYTEFFTFIDEIKLKTLLLTYNNLSNILYIMIKNMKNSILNNDFDVNVYCLFNHILNDEDQDCFDRFCENNCIYSSQHGCCDEIDSTYDKITNGGNTLMKDLIGRERIIGYIEKKFIL